MSDRLSRRDFLLYGGATAAGVTLGQWGRHLLARADDRLRISRPPGLETWSTSVCRECPAACGVRVRLVDDVPVKLEGNPACPIGRGRLCAKGQAGIESYFDPDRLVAPARRIGRRGEQRWEPITWAAATTLLASHLNGQVSGASQALAIAVEEHGPLAAAWEQFWTAAGAHVAWTPAATPARLRGRFAALTGVDRDPLFDLEHATHVLSFGARLAEDWLSPVWTARSFGRFRRGPSKARGWLVQVDVHRSITARKADEWLALGPDEQLALAYGIASVILRENRVAGSLLDMPGGNLATFERAIVERYSPDEVAASTGIPVVTLLRMARDYASAPNALAVVAADATPALADAVFALNALVGAFERQGGIFVSPAASIAEPDDATVALRAVAAGSIHPRVLALRDGSALRAMTAPLNLEAALGQSDFVVSFSPYLDETAAVADLLMPTHTALEAWHCATPPHVVASESLAFARPAVAPRLDTRGLVAALKATAEAAGGPLLQACPWSTDEQVVRSEIGRVFGLRRGGPYSGTFENEWLGQLERGGWWVPAADSRDAFADKALEAGGWVDPFFEVGSVRKSVQARGGFSFPMPPAAPVPVSTVRPASGSVDPRFPLRLVPFTPATVNLTGGPNHPVLFELLGQPEGAPWRVWAELSPDTARQLGIEHGAEVQISSATGSIRATVLLVAGMSAAAVAVAFVPANAQGGRWARLMDADVRRVVSRGASVCHVRVTRA